VKQPRIPASAAAAQERFATAVRLHREGQLGKAERLYRQILSAYPAHADTLNLLGVVTHQLRRDGSALELLKRAIAINPNFAPYHSNLGQILHDLGRTDEAIASCGRAIQLSPAFPEAYNTLAIALEASGQFDEAIASCRRAIGLEPDYAEAHSNLGSALRQQGRLDEAAAAIRRSVELNPQRPEALSNLGNVLQDADQLDEAISCYRRAIAIRSNYPQAYNNLGTAMRRQQRLDEAIACYRRAIVIDPHYADAHYNLGMALLAAGEMAEGWREHEWRWKTPGMLRGARHFPQPQWDGEPAEGKTLLIHPEQGFGDSLHFCRYATLAAERGLRVVLEAPEPLVRILRSLAGVESVLATGQPLPPFDLHCPMLSMPLAMRTTLATIPAAGAYLRADAAQAAAFGARLRASGVQGPKIGLVWAGNSRLHVPGAALLDRRRSIAPQSLAPLLDLPGLHFVSLQKDGPAAPAHFPLTDFMAEMNDFADTAALIATLDLVISVDTAVAHLAAALGTPVWLLDRFDPCWRWLTSRRNTPWYPGLRLYRQPQPGDWERVVAEVARDLRDHFAPASH